MLNRKIKYDNSPKLQSKIVLCLAKEGPLIVNATNEKIKGGYTSTNRAFHVLVAKGLIEKAGDTRVWRKREFPRYWLTVSGAGQALLNGVKADYVKENALKSNKNEADRKAIEVYFRLRDNASPKMRTILDEFIFQRGRLQARELIIKLLPDMLSIGPTETDKLMKTVKEFPEWGYVRASLEKMKKEIEKVLSRE